MKSRRGFTIVELLIVIVIIATLAMITIFSFGSWRKRTARTEVKQDLSVVVSSLKNYRNFNNVYPGTAGGAAVSPTSLSGLDYRVNSNVTTTYQLRLNGESYCLKSVSTVVPSEIWYVDSAVGSNPTTTACS